MKKNLLKMFVMCQCFALAFCSCENKNEDNFVNGVNLSVNKVESGYNVYDDTKDLSDTELMDYIKLKSEEYKVDICAVSNEGYQRKLDSLLNMCLFERIENNAFTNETIGLLQGYIVQLENAISSGDSVEIETNYLHIYNVLNCTEYVSIKDITLNGRDELAIYTTSVGQILQEVEECHPNFQKLSQEQKEDVLYLASLYGQIKLNNSKAAPISDCERCTRNYNRAKSQANAVAVVGISGCALLGPAGFSVCSAIVLAELAVDLAFILADYRDCVDVNC